MLIKAVEGGDQLQFDFRLCLQNEHICEFRFHIKAAMCGIVHEAEQVWISCDALNRFIEELRQLHSSLQGKASVQSVDDDFGLHIESVGQRGYLLVRASFRFVTEFQNYKAENHFQGNVFIEPANLSDWLSELATVFTERTPSTDFLGNWNTSLPLPNRLRKP